MWGILRNKGSAIVLVVEALNLSWSVQVNIDCAIFAQLEHFVEVVRS